MSEYSAVISNTTYPGSPNHIASGIGPFSISHLGDEGTPDVLISFDGVTTAYRVYAGSTYTPHERDCPATMFLRLESPGSVLVKMNRSRWDGFYG